MQKRGRYKPIAELTEEQRLERNERQRRWRLANPEKIARYKKNWHEANPEANKNIGWRRRLVLVYGTDPSVYDRLFALQDGVCAICLHPESRKRGGRVMRLAIDHDHQTGNVRGLLCSNCNIVLGQLKTTDALKRAFRYLSGELYEFWGSV